MKRYILTLLAIFVLSIASVSAAPQDKQKRQAWYNNMIQTKVDYLAKQLAMTPDQKTKFEKSYKEMAAETSKLANETRAMEKSVSSKASPTDLEYEKAAEAMAEFKSKEGAIELKYYKQYKTFLTKKQLFQLKIAENKWMREVMRHRAKKGK